LFFACAVAAMVCSPSLVHGQSQPPGQAAAAALPPVDPASKLTAILTVNANASVEAVLLPPNVTRGVFGKAIADRYAAVELTVSNRSHDAALIVHSIFIDYSRWLFSGTTRGQLVPCPPTEVRTNKAAAPASESSPQATLPECLNPLEPWQAANKSNQVAAAEYRVPRGTLLDSQQWSGRNWAVRIAETAGTIATAFAFGLTGADSAKVIAAYNGAVVPGIRYLIPDSTVQQANRLEDLGFRINKIIPKDSSEILVAFFPLDRFLTPGVKRLYHESPAIFFVPQSVIFDPKARALLADVFKGLNIGLDSKEFQQLAELLRTDPDKAAESPVIKLLDRISLNNLRLVVGGIMSVDVDIVPATIEGVQFDELDPAMLWAETGQKKGTFTGRYLSGGMAALVNADTVQITDVSSIQEGSDDHTLHFQITVNKSVAGATKLIFRADKKDKAGRSIEGHPFEYVVPEIGLVAPIIEKVERDGDTLTITGQRFFSTDANPLSVTLVPSAVAGVDSKALKNVDRKPRELKIDLAPLALAPACWTPHVSVGTANALGGAAFAQAPAPKIASAKKNGTRIVLAGEQFIDLKTCDKPLVFEVAEQAAGSAFKVVTSLTIASSKEVSFDLPKAPPDGRFKVRVLVGDVERDTKNVE
jgi:hypothetical protein